MNNDVYFMYPIVFQYEIQIKSSYYFWFSPATHPVKALFEDIASSYMAQRHEINLRLGFPVSAQRELSNDV